MIQYCLSHGIELTGSRPYRKNDQAWVEQKNGSVVRKLLGYQAIPGNRRRAVLGKALRDGSALRKLLPTLV